MASVVKYRHPVTGNVYYFKDLRSKDGSLRPVGVMRYHRHMATIFQCDDDAERVRFHLTSLGYDAWLIDPPQPFYVTVRLAGSGVPHASPSPAGGSIPPCHATVHLS